MITTAINEIKEIKEKLNTVAQAVQSQCDGARSIDGVGFNKFDTEFFKNFLNQEEPSFSSLLSAYNSIKKYKRQIESLGYLELLNSIKFDKDTLSAEWIAYRKQLLLDIFKEIESKPVPSKNLLVKVLNINSERKWIWDIYKTDKEWFKTNSLSVKKNDYEGGVWQVLQWEELPENPKPKTTITTTVPSVPKKELVFPSSIELNYSNKLLSYQVEHAKFLLASLKNFNAVLDASDTGTGKTFSALACAKELGLVPFVLTPKSVIPSWIKACKHFEIEGSYITNYEAIKTGKTEYLKKDSSGEYTWNLPSNAILIFDEVHRCKNKDTLNAKLLIASKKANVPIVCLSATIADNPTQLYAVGSVLELYGYRQYSSWLRSLGGRYNEREMRYEFTKDSLVKVNTQIFPSKGHRISIKDLGDLFPETRILPETFTVSEATQKAVNELYNIINTALGSLKEKEAKDKGHHLTDLLRARQEIELLKIPVFLELAEDALAENNSVVIIVNFTETLQALAKKLNTKCVIHGSQTAQERQKNIEDFQSDKEKVIILNIRSGGVGVSLHDLNGNHPRVSLISPSWSAQDIVQAVGRVWRAGGKSHSIQKIVYCANTVEEGICDRMKYKIDNINTINESAISEVFASLSPEE